MSIFHGLRQIFRHGPSGFQQICFGCRRVSTPGPNSLVARFQRHSSRLSQASFQQAIMHNDKTSPWLITRATVVGLGLGLASLHQSPVYCDYKPSKVGAEENLPPLPVSSVSLSELSFGTVAGICTGVFVKKGAKLAASFLGGIFVLLQYLHSSSFVRVDWVRISNKFEDLFSGGDAARVRKPFAIGSLWKSLVDFLTADFQPRASFIAGFVLGLRIG